MSGLLGFYFISWIVSGVVHNTKFQAETGLVTRICFDNIYNNADLSSAIFLVILKIT